MNQAELVRLVRKEHERMAYCPICNARPSIEFCPRLVPTKIICHKCGTYMHSALLESFSSFVSRWNFEAVKIKENRGKQ